MKELIDLPPTQPPLRRSMQIALFLTGGLWAIISRAASEHAASGIAVRFSLETFEPLLSAAFLLFLIVVGFSAIHWVATRDAPLLVVSPLPRRPSAAREWGIGAVLGWSMLVLTLAPMTLGGFLIPHFWMAWRGVGLLLLSIATLAVLTLALEAAFRGYLFVRLIRVFGETGATILIAVLYAVVSGMHAQSTRLSVFVAFLLSILYSLAYLRTRALWLPWGLHFAWAASMGSIFGLPVGGEASYSSLVDTAAHGPEWMTGGLYGPEGSLIAAAAVLIAMVALYKLTTDFAWQFTFDAPAPAGYAMEAKPPAAHVAMEQAAKPAPLVQILSTTPASASTMPAVEEHLRATTRTPDSTE